MRLQKENVVSLGENEYRVIDTLGSGALSDVYLAAPLSVPEATVVIKLVRDEASLDLEKLVAGLRREAEVLAILNRAEDARWPVEKGLRVRLSRARATAAERRVVALLDSGEIWDGESSQPFLVQEKAPPAFEWPTVTGLADERRILAVAEALASLMALAHRHNFTFKDFDPGSKWDRIRVGPLSPGQSPAGIGGGSAGRADGPSFELKLIDWEITGTADPEEVAQDLFFFGGHLYHFLLGSQVMLDMNGQPPARLGLGVAGWEQITVGSRQLLARLLHRDPARRYQQASELLADLSWWLDTLRLAASSPAQQPLQRRMLQARRQKRHDRVFALTELALTLELPLAAQQAFAMWSKQAQQELSKVIRLPIAMAQATLLTGDYEKARINFNKQLRVLPANSPTARLARLYLRLARAGSELRQAYEGADIRSTPEWEALSRATNALSQEQWSEAAEALHEATRHRSGVAHFSAVAELRQLAQAGLRSQEAAELLAGSEPADAERDDWTEIEARKVADLNKAVELLREAQKLAPLEPEFGEQRKAAEARHKQRQARLDHYQEVDRFVAQGEQHLEAAGNEPDRQAAATRYQQAGAYFRAALEALKAIETHSTQHERKQHRAQILRSRVERLYGQADQLRQVAQARAEAEEHLARGAYKQALVPARRAVALQPQDKALQELLELAQVGARLLRQAEGDLEIAAEELRRRNLDEAQEKIERVFGWRHQPLASLPGGESLSASVGPRFDLHFALHFRLPDALDHWVHSLRDEYQLLREVRPRVEEARSPADYETVIRELKRLEGRSIRLTEEESERLRDAESQVETLTKARELIALAQTFEQLAEAHDLLSGHPSAQAAALRQQIGEKWVDLAEGVSNLQEVRRILDEGLKRLSDTPSGPRLQQMRRLVQVAYKSFPDLELKGQRLWPVWMEKEERSERLKLLNRAFEILIGPQSWPFLRRLIEQRRQRLIAIVADYLRQRQSYVVKLCKKSNFKQAQTESSRTWHTIPDAFREQLPADVAEAWPGLVAALKQRGEADQVGRQLMKGLAREELAFGEAAQLMNERLLPAHPDVPADDLSALREELQELAKMESELQEPLTADKYAPRIHQRRSLATQPIQSLFNARPALARRLRSRVQDLKRSLILSADSIGEQLYQALYQAAQLLIQEPTSEPEPLLRLYWQVRWWQQATSTAQLEADAATSTAQLEADAAILASLSTIRAALGLAEARFMSMSRRDQSDGLSNALETLQTLNLGLARLPFKEGQPLVTLPPLPEGASLDNEPQLDQRAVERWIATTDYLQALSATEGALIQHEKYVPSQVLAIERQAFELEQELQSLQEEVWPRLALSEWADDSLPAQLEQEASLHQKLAAALQEADRKRKEGEAVSSVLYFERQIATPRLVEQLSAFTLWLLEPQRQLLTRNLEALRRNLMSDLDQEVSEARQHAEEELARGNYQSALAAVQETITSSFPSSGNRELQEIVAWAKAGERLVAEMRKSIEVARQELLNRNLDEADQGIQHILRSHHQPLAFLLEEQSLPDMVRYRLFNLPERLHQVTLALQEELRLVRQVSTEVQKAHSKGDHETVSQQLKRLDRTSPLTEKERQWLKESYRKAGKIDQARKFIQPKTSLEELRQADDLLSGDSSADATQLCHQMATQWAKLAESITELETLGDVLQEGIQRLGETPHSKRLKEMLALAEQAYQLSLELERKHETRWPAWLAEEKRHERLNSFSQTFEALTGPASWPSLRTLSEQWQKKVINTLADYMRQNLPEVRTLSKAYKFEDALNLLKKLWHTVPAAFRKQLPISLTWDLERFIEALTQRVEVEQASHNLVQKLATKELTFGEVASKMAQLSLPTHPDIPVDDLDSLRQEVQQMAKTESEHQRLVRSDDYATSIHQLRVEAQELSIIQSRLAPDFAKALNEPVEQLNQALTSSVSQVTSRLQQALHQAAQRLQEQPNSDQEPFLRLYWQQRWWEQSTPAASSDADSAVRAILAAAAERFVKMSNNQELDQLSNALEGLQKLNLRLAGQPPTDLPPLPEGKPVAQTARLDQEAIKAWIVVTDHLKFLSTEQAPSDHKEYNPNQVKAVGEQAKQLLTELERLKAKTWEPLKLAEWANDSTPARLKQEAQLYQKLAQQLAHVYQKLAQQLTDVHQMRTKTLEALGYFERHIAKAALTKLHSGLWLLEYQRTNTAYHYKALRTNIESDLTKQIKEILAVKNEEDAITDLRQDIIIQADTVAVVEVAEKTILQAIDQYADRPNEMRRAVRIVRDATSPKAKQKQKQSWRQKLTSWWRKTSS